jgi:hypothetical protein
MNVSFDVVGIVISAFICFALAALWFSPALFGKIWFKEMEKNGSVVQEFNELKMYYYVFIPLIVFGVIENIIVDIFSISGLREGVGVGIAIWLLISSAHAAIHFAFERRSIILFGIYSSYYLAASVIFSTILSMRQ